ncbi:hypothetical protein HHI36_020362 [Cryptolaemus montrouzieri]|uniref:Collagen type XV/XVIII trimerization domain-containing protein n=1 Tax=Cryptolaemus montrouzieri TaxID=559131 RepID=A0ABD2NAQ4_9CUCU
MTPPPCYEQNPTYRGTVLKRTIRLQLIRKKIGRATASPPVLKEEDVPRQIVPGAVSFQDKTAMMKMTSISPVGTIAYVIEEEAILVRVNNGWQYIALGSLLPVTTPAPPTTNNPHLRPPFEVSNLINHISKPADISNSVYMMALASEIWRTVQYLRRENVAIKGVNHFTILEELVSKEVKISTAIR